MSQQTITIPSEVPAGEHVVLSIKELEAHRRHAGEDISIVFYFDGADVDEAVLTLAEWQSTGEQKLAALIPTLTTACNYEHACDIFDRFRERNDP